MRRKTVAVIGDAAADENGAKYRLAFETGKALVDAGYRVQSGGLGGVMEAAFRGAKSSPRYRDGDTVAIVPSFCAADANEYADVVIPTGLDIMRNAVVVNADAVVAVGGGAGTLSEMAVAWSLGKLIVAYDSVDGWSSELAGRRIDGRIRYADIADDRVYEASNAADAVKIVQEKARLYVARHEGIKFRK